MAWTYPATLVAMVPLLAACGSSDESGLFTGGGGGAGRAASGGGGSGSDASAGASSTMGGAGGANATGGRPATGGRGGSAATGAALSGGSGGAPAGGAGNAGGTMGVDASLPPPGGAPTLLDGAVVDGATPGTIVCGGVLCEIVAAVPNVCCAAPPFPFPVECLPSFPGCVTAGIPMACDDAADCQVGQVCCASPTASPSGCAAACDANQIQLCRTDAECVAGTCQGLAGTEYARCQ